MPLRKWMTVVCLGTLLIVCRSWSAEPVFPLVHAHAHNDYQHARPLLDALDYGFCSVEADIHLVEGQLLVAHDREDVKTDRMLRARPAWTSSIRMTWTGSSGSWSKAAIPMTDSRKQRLIRGRRLINTVPWTSHGRT